MKERGLLLKAKKKCFFLINYFEEIICSILLFAIVVLVGWSVIGRFIFMRNWAWHEEIIRFFFVTMILIGVSMAAKKEAHIRISILTKTFADEHQKWINLLSDLFWLIMNVVILGACVPLMRSMRMYVTTTAAIGIAEYYFYSIVPISLILTSIRIIQIYVRRYKDHGNIFMVVKSDKGNI